MQFLTLENKNVLITGASSGIGQDAAVMLSKLGAKLVIHGRNVERLQATFDMLKGEGHSMAIGDLTNDADIETLVRSLPALNGLVNCAGIIYPHPIKFITRANIDEAMSANFTSAALLTSMCARLKKLARGCSIIFISSISTSHPYRGGALYVSSKAALEAFSRTVALELSNLKIRSNVISPALVKTPIFYETKAANPEGEMEKYEKQYPLGVGETEDVSNMIAFLLADNPDWVTGINVTMDGGLLIGSK